APPGPKTDQVRCGQVWGAFFCVWIPEQVDRMSTNGWARRFLLTMKTAFSTASGCCHCYHRLHLGPRRSRSGADKYGGPFFVFGSRNKSIGCRQKVGQERFLLTMKTAFSTASGCCHCYHRLHLGPRRSRSSADKYGGPFCVFGSRNKSIGCRQTVGQDAF